MMIGAVALITSGCGVGPRTPNLDPTTGAVARQRQAAIDSMTQGAAVIATALGAGAALGVRTDTTCTSGEKGWPHNDDEQFRSTCSAQVTMAYAVDTAPLPALGGLEAPLAEVGWHIGGRVANAAWNLTGGRGSVDNLEAFTRLGYTLPDLEGLSYLGPRGATLYIQPRAADFAVPAPAPVVTQGGFSYFATNEGTNWQDNWSQQRSEHPYVVLVAGSLTFAEQPW